MKKILITICIFLITNNLFAYHFPTNKLFTTAAHNNVGESYISGDDNGLIFSWANGTNYSSNIRFSMFFNLGYRYNYNIAKNVAIFTGLGIKNVGTSDKFNGLVFRRRSYYIGAPLGLNLKNLVLNSDISFGTGLDVTLNYKEKFWVENSKKSTKVKENWWFDNTNTNLFNPYLFIGVKRKGISLKYQYYTSTFTKGGNDHLQFISISFGKVKFGSEKTKNNSEKKIKKSIDSI